VRRVLSLSQLVLRPSGGGVSGYCQSSAGYSVKGIPSLDETFGWQSGAYSGGARVTGDRGFSTWSANASGEAVQAPIGGLSIVRSGSATCPMLAPTFSVRGATANNAFSIPIMLTYRHGTLWNVSVSKCKVCRWRKPRRGHVFCPAAVGIPARSQMAARIGDVPYERLRPKTLTITSTGAQIRNRPTGSSPQHLRRVPSLFLGPTLRKRNLCIVLAPTAIRMAHRNHSINA